MAESRHGEERSDAAIQGTSRSVPLLDRHAAKWRLAMTVKVGFVGPRRVDVPVTN